MKVNYSPSKSRVAVERSTEIDVVINFQGELERSNRLGVDLSGVLDLSGLMSGSSLRNAIKAAKLLVEHLQPEYYL